MTTPLVAAGWESHGKTLLRGDFHDGLGVLALIRVGGKKARPGCIGHMIGFRHRFLRELVDLTVPDLLPKQHNDWPLRARPQEFGGWWGRPKLKPFSFGEPMEIAYLRWEGSPSDEVLADLDGLRACLEGPVTKWARSYTAKRVQKDLVGARRARIRRANVARGLREAPCRGLNERGQQRWGAGRGAVHRHPALVRREPPCAVGAGAAAPVSGGSPPPALGAVLARSGFRYRESGWIEPVDAPFDGAVSGTWCPHVALGALWRVLGEAPCTTATSFFIRELRGAVRTGPRLESGRRFGDELSIDGISDGQVLLLGWMSEARFDEVGDRFHALIDELDG